ncbi:molybdate ABC transporter substrate-binding protein [Mycobacterium sp.]|uniref:molybdate ABC transporter substrate-binding protein n=1 Tax=Mycobacterium sp. TaxID=1785 RepID=UPI002CC85CEA|nr:molybdate ABC transporter substrate-binding protein [Mycobacterium sp.]HKP42144.1 molybdate ABC transporter substrate-binding protein [Mycobacterium sp.]
MRRISTRNQRWRPLRAQLNAIRRKNAHDMRDGTYFAEWESVSSWPMRRRLKQTMAVGIALVVSAAGCSTHSEPATMSITVFASSSMIKSLTAIGKQFEAENPGDSVEFIFASSSELSGELTDGIDADVFVSGDHDNMSAVANAGLVEATPAAVAANSLVIATAPGNHGSLASFADLARPGVRVAVCGGTGTCSSATQQVEDRTAVRLHAQNVDTTPTDVIKDIMSGNVDAGVVFKTDALNAGDKISWFAFPEAADAAVTSWIAAMKNSDQAELASKFVQDVTSVAGRKVFNDNGFAEPDKKFAG